MTYLRGRLYFVVSLCCVSILCQRSSRGLRGWLDTTFQPRQKPLGSDLLAVAAYLGVTRAPAGDSLFFLLGFIAVVSGRFNFIVIVVTSDIKGSLGVGSDTWGIVGLWSLAGLLHGVFFFLRRSWSSFLGPGLTTCFGGSGCLPAQNTSGSRNQGVSGAGEGAWMVGHHSTFLFSSGSEKLPLEH